MESMICVSMYLTTRTRCLEVTAGTGCSCPYSSHILDNVLHLDSLVKAFFTVQRQLYSCSTLLNTHTRHRPFDEKSCYYSQISTLPSTASNTCTQACSTRHYSTICHFPDSHIASVCPEKKINNASGLSLFS